MHGCSTSNLASIPPMPSPSLSLSTSVAKFAIAKYQHGRSKNLQAMAPCVGIGHLVLHFNGHDVHHIELLLGSHPIWLGTLAGAGTSQLSTTGFKLDPGQTVQLAAPMGWSGRIWTRTGCVFDADGAGVCQTGDCGGRMEYHAAGHTLRGHAGEGRPTGCMADLNRSCPRELMVDCGGGAIACRSACEAFGQDRYCCSGAYDTPAACHPTVYSSIFKSACPRAYSYAYDDSTSTFTCKAYDYTIAFCFPPPAN